MTERIDLDDFDADESTAEDRKPRGSWFWEGDGDPDDEVDPWTGSASDSPNVDTDTTAPATADAATARDGAAVDTHGDESGGAHEADADDADDADSRQPIPRVPRTNEDRPVGIPMESGGAGGTFAGAESPPDVTPDADPDSGPDGETADTAATSETTATADRAEAEPEGDAAEPTSSGGAAQSAEPSGPHGGGVDEMTLAFTYNAITRLEQLHGALADANGWTDWIGLVGDVEAYVINKFQRDNHLDLDFFNGSGTGPGERLAAIDEHSMFYAERMVVVGVEGEDEYVAEEAGWEFVPLADAAAKAGWEVED
jgi:hypothetical protein